MRTRGCEAGDPWRSTNITPLFNGAYLQDQCDDRPDDDDERQAEPGAPDAEFVEGPMPRDDPLFRDRLVLVEGYNIALARLLVQGVDVWLNTPRRPLEASGTSGMKAAAHGALNRSISDGWWWEGYVGDNGWVIGEEQVADDPAAQDAADAESLFNLLENEVTSTFYERDEHGVPRRWIARMKAAVGSVVPRFSSARMVDEYVDRYYVPCAGD